MSETDAKIARLEANTERILEELRDMRSEKKTAHAGIHSAIDTLEEQLRGHEKRVDIMWHALRLALGGLVTIVGVLLKRWIG